MKTALLFGFQHTLTEPYIHLLCLPRSTINRPE